MGHGQDVFDSLTVLHGEPYRNDRQLSDIGKVRSKYTTQGAAIYSRINAICPTHCKRGERVIYHVSLIFRFQWVIYLFLSIVINVCNWTI